MVDDTCAHCGAMFPARRTGGKPQTYCGKACYSAAATVRRRERRPWKLTPCCVCRKLVRSHGDGTVCSDECRRIREEIRNVVAREGGAWIPIDYYVCPECGRLFVGRVRANRVYCSRRCASIATRRAYKHRRRTLGRSGDYITIQRLGDRDGWVCHICRKRVTKKRSNMPNAPSIDHLVPLSDDGEHRWVNVALAHKACNSRRRTSGPAQLRLN